VSVTDDAPHDTFISLPPAEGAAALVLAAREEEDRQIARLLAAPAHPELEVAGGRVSGAVLPASLREACVQFLEAAQYGAEVALLRRRHRERTRVGGTGAGFSHLRGR